MTRIALVAVLFVAFAAPAQVLDPAQLFPADTPAYVELAKPAETFDALAALLKQSPLADPLAHTHDRLEKAPDASRLPSIQNAGRFGLLASPELLAELKRLRGAALGMTGFSAKGEPRGAAVVLLGDSHGVGFAVRALLTTTPNLRRVAVVDGVPIFQYRAFVGPVSDPNTGRPLGPNDEDNPLRGHKLSPGASEPTFAYTPGLFVAGTDADAVTDVLRRFSGKTTTATLASAADFKSAISTGRATPGFVGYADVPMLFAKWDAAKKAAGLTVEPDAFAWVRFAANPKAIRRLTANVQIQPDAFGIALNVDRDPAIPSPLFDALSGPPLRIDAGRAAAADARWAFSLGLPAANRRSAALLSLADALAKANGTLGRLPSDAAKSASEEKWLDLKRDLLDGIEAITLFDPLTQTVPNGATAWPTVVLHASDATAGNWDTLFPKFARLLASADADPTPSSEMVNGIRVRTVPGTGLPWNAPLHFARAGNAVALGLDRTVVAAAVERTNRPANAVASENIGTGVLRLAAYAPKPLTKPKPPVRPPDGGPFAPPPLPEFLPGSNIPNAGGTPGSQETPLAAVARTAKHLPAMSLTLTRTGTSIRLEAWHRELAKPLGLAARDLLLWLETRPVPNPNGYYGQPQYQSIESDVIVPPQ